MALEIKLATIGFLVTLGDCYHLDGLEQLVSIEALNRSL
jgi:hypothetical protein